MAIDVKSKELSNSTFQIKIKGDIIINNVTNLKKQLDDDYTKYSILNFDLEKVDKIDTSGFQLVISFLKWIKSNEIEVNFVKISDDVLDISNLYDVDLNKFV